MLLLAALSAWLWSRRGLIMPRKTDGALPFQLRTMSADDSRIALAQRQAADVALASQQPVPQSLTWSPRYDYRNQQDIQTAQPAELPSVAPLAFRDLQLDPLSVYLGATEQGPVIRPWDQLLTLAISGQTGSGKTFTATSIVLQSLFAGHQVILCDPHAHNDESLAARLRPVHGLLSRPTAVTDREVAASVEAVERVLRDRAEGRSDDLRPVTLVLDEFSKVMRGSLAETVARILEGVAAEGRKLGVRAIL
ncbi:MAG: hypothetical protein GEV09_26270, partial [Pseudonocardiaceae bacterium]|nr:hypothetical protein [Pseudonocardiaceae bacterium]